MQSRRQSAAEVLTNTFAGTIGSGLIVYATLNFIDDKIAAATVSTLACTVWSLVRGYSIRRLFNRKQQ